MRLPYTRTLMSIWSILATLALAIAPPSVMADDEAAPAAPSIPADAEGASKALLDSPRHGEWVDLDIPGSDTKLHTWVVYPERSDKAPVVIVIHEIFGLTDWVRAVADQLAADGFIAIAPDLLSGMGPDGGGSESLGENARNVIRTLSPDETGKRLDVAREYGIKLPAANGKSASVGYCWGGSASFNYATQQPKLNAAVVYYGTAPTDPEAIKKINCPVLGLYGEDDARINATLDATESMMKEHSKPFAKHIYAKAGHGFLRQQSGREGANKFASEQAWTETLRFLREHTK